MPLPKPLPGLVLSYRYLWDREQRAGLIEGRKARPCVIVVKVGVAEDGETVVVVPVTHLPPDDRDAVEIPRDVKTRLGLDAERSWVLLGEANEFVWPGPDLQTIPGSSDRFAYGFLPASLFRTIVTRMYRIRLGGRGRVVRRGS